MRQNSRLKLDAAIYSTAIQAVCKKPKSNVACELLNEMKKMGWVPSEGTFTSVIGACVKQKNMVDASKLKDEMVSSRKPMNLVVATSLMKGYCMQDDLDGALNLFETREMRSWFAPSSLAPWSIRSLAAHRSLSSASTSHSQPQIFNANSTSQPSTNTTSNTSQEGRT
ncbi:unnamed protein product [Camellia sinensis]